MKIRIDWELCIGVGNCVAVAPSVFQLDKDNKAIIIDPSSVDEITLKEAASSCPEMAIILEDESGQQLFP
jgi:ferredoxin